MITAKWVEAVPLAQALCCLICCPQKKNIVRKNTFLPRSKGSYSAPAVQFLQGALEGAGRYQNTSMSPQESFHTEEAPSAVHGESVLKPCISQARSATSGKKHLKQPGKSCPVSRDGV